MKPEARKGPGRVPRGMLAVRIGDEEFARFETVLKRFEDRLGFTRSHVVRLALTLGLDALDTMDAEALGRAIFGSNATTKRTKPAAT
jgi:hypothetical protein